VEIAKSVAFPSTALSADFDNDGYQDIVVAAYETGEPSGLFLFRDNGNRPAEGERGQFQDNTQIATGTANALNSADIDGDGDQDLLVGNFGETHWLENVDSASKWIRHDSISTERVFLTVFGDVDSDGDVDLVGINGSNKLVLLENADGKGDFADAQLIDTDQQWVEQIELVDIDADSDLDLVFSGTRLAWYKNNGSGFGINSEAQVLVENAKAFGTGDYDNDGDTDIVAGSRKDVYVLTNNTGEFTTQTINIRSNSSDTTIDDVFFYDTDGDDDTDVLVQLDLDDDFGLEVVSNNAGEFAQLGQRISDFPAEDIVMSTRGDLNGDQIDDFVIYTSDEGYVGWMEIRDNSVQYHDVPENSALGVNAINVADFDGDSDLDLLVSSRDDAEVAWYENRDGEYVYAEQIERVSNVDSIPFDVNDDGIMDVVTLSWSGLSWFENRGRQQSRFGMKRMVGPNMWGARGISSADTDGDGTSELLVVDSFGVAVFDVVGRRLELIQRISINDVDSIDLNDADSDGDEDLLVSQFQSNRRDHERPILYANNGGAFSKSTEALFPESVSVWTVKNTFADMDQDGDADLLANRNEQLVWYANNGNATWSSMPTSVGDVRPIADIEIADLDNDGDLDVLTHDRWFENQDQGASFVEHIRNWGAVFSAVDIDFDGDLDVLTSNGYRLVLNENRLIDLVVRVPGDSNGDGRFDSSDFVLVFQAGQYEDEIAENSIFETGDWNGDGEFNSSDFVFAFTAGNYVAAARQRQLEFAAAIDSVFADSDQDHNPYGPLHAI
jgi:hypothetical protein